MSPTSEPTLETRATPVQQRGQARVDALLDAAAEIVELSGIAAMTTSAIAERSGSSVGVVYRYFPNADAVLVALAERNRDQFAHQVAEETERQDPADWQAFASMCIDIYASMAQSIPGFRTIRFGDVVSMRFLNRESSNNEILGAHLDRYFIERYGFAPTQDLVFATDLAMECADAVTRRAFLHKRAGEVRFIEAAKKIVVAILTPQAPETYGQHVQP